eukprot:scaffold8684_cov112-Isochrysis_galbana.AAC.2
MSAVVWSEPKTAARSLRVWQPQPAFIVSYRTTFMDVATAEPVLPLVCAAEQSMASKSLRHEQRRDACSAAL